VHVRMLTFVLLDDEIEAALSRLFKLLSMIHNIQGRNITKNLTYDGRARRLSSVGRR
jgi:transposase